jgi:hypothetical protein
MLFCIGQDNIGLKSIGDFMKRKVFLAAALFAFMAVGVYAQTEADFEVDSGTIYKYNGSATTVNIPAKIKNVAVTKIETDAFSNPNITSVVIPNGVTSIENGAFRGCQKLTSITIGSGVTTIGQAAFSGCRSLASVTIPASVKTIGFNVFGGCTSLTSVTFQGSIPASGFNASAFGRDNELGDIRDKYLAANGGAGTYTRPNSTSKTWTKGTSAAAPAAAGTPGLAFKLTSDGKGYVVSEGTVKGEVVIPASYNNLPVTKIPDFGFMSNLGIVNLTIPNSVKEIGSKAFASCGNMTSVTFQGTITAADFVINAFDGDLRAKYLAAGGGIGTYTRTAAGTTWTKK